VTSTLLVTGASRGLGLALVERFLEDSWSVVAGQYGPSAALERLGRGFSDRLVVLPLDVSSLESVETAARQVAARTPALDVLVNNAGILPEAARGKLGSLDFQAGMRVYDVNGLGPLRVTQAFFPLLAAGGRKLVVNVSSEAGSIADCRRTDDYFYCMSKAALNMQSMILSNHLAPLGFKVLAVHPGWMRTGMGGPRAHLDPAESAQGISALVARSWQPGAAAYVDYSGQPLRW